MIPNENASHLANWPKLLRKHNMLYVYNTYTTTYCVPSINSLNPYQLSLLDSNIQLVS